MAYGNNGGGGYNRGNGGGYGGQRQQQRGGGYQNRSGNNRCTPKQAEILQKYGYNPSVSFDQASQIIDQLAANGWQRPNQHNGGNNGGYQRRPTGGGNGYGRPPQQQQQQQRPPQQRPQQGGGYQGGGNQQGQCTAKQAAVLEKYGYDPNVSFDEASQIIDDLAANGWQRPDEGNQDGGNNFGGYQADVQYGDDGSAPWNEASEGDTY